MELLELKTKLLAIFNLATVEEMPDYLMQHLNDDEIRKEVVDLLPDLKTDWLQKVYQYYLADRKEKKQDYTPKSIAKLIASLTSHESRFIDYCAGSGALTIQKWTHNPEATFECYELDKRVIPILLFNLAIRKIEANVYHADILEDTIYQKFMIRDGVVKVDDNNQ